LNKRTKNKTLKALCPNGQIKTADEKSVGEFLKLDYILPQIPCKNKMKISTATTKCGAPAMDK
jgi:hypothetical protein